MEIWSDHIVTLAERITIYRGKATYEQLREKRLHIIEPRSPDESFNPDTPRTLMDILGESAERTRILIIAMRLNNNLLKIRQLFC